jgi:hypothetical protein
MRGTTVNRPIQKLISPVLLGIAGLFAAPAAGHAFQSPYDGCCPSESGGVYPYPPRYYGSVSPYPIGYYPQPAFYGYSAGYYPDSVGNYPYAIPSYSYAVGYYPYTAGYYPYQVGYYPYAGYYAYPYWGAFYP